MDFKMPNQSQVLAFGRHIVSGAGGAIAYASFLHLFQNPHDMAAATDAVNHIDAGFKEMVGGIFALIPIVMGVIAALKSSPLVQFAMSAAAMLHSKSDTKTLSTEEQKVIMQATEKLPKVEKIVTNDPVIAATTPEPCIVSSQNTK